MCVLKGGTADRGILKKKYYGKKKMAKSQVIHEGIVG